MSITGLFFIGVPIVFLIIVIRAVMRAGRKKMETHTSGRASGFQTRVGSNVTIWNFRVESFDSQGNLVARVAVELRGVKIFGAIRDGDDIEVWGNRRAGLTLMAKRIYNITTDETISTGSFNSTAGTIGMIVFILFFIVFVLFGLLTTRFSLR